MKAQELVGPTNIERLAMTVYSQYQREIIHDLSESDRHRPLSLLAGLLDSVVLGCLQTTASVIRWLSWDRAQSFDCADGSRFVADLRGLNGGFRFYLCGRSVDHRESGKAFPAGLETAQSPARPTLLSTLWYGVMMRPVEAKA